MNQMFLQNLQQSQTSLALPCCRRIAAKLWLDFHPKVLFDPRFDPWFYPRLDTRLQPKKLWLDFHSKVFCFKVKYQRQDLWSTSSILDGQLVTFLVTGAIMVTASEAEAQVGLWSHWQLFDTDVTERFISISFFLAQAENCIQYMVLKQTQIQTEIFLAICAKISNGSKLDHNGFWSFAQKPNM